MNVDALLEYAIWSFAVLAIGGGAAAAVASTWPRRQWLIVPAAGVVALVLLLGLFGLVPEPPFHALGVLAGLGLGVIGVAGGSPVVILILRAASANAVPGTHGGILVDGKGDTPPPRREILRGGATIGYLERAAVIGCILAGQPGGVAVLVAIKGLGRFSELENALARERFLIGSLASLLWAGACVAAVMIWW
ncbi:hypothetical protein ACFFGH_30035 [Lysobacter korlensis]|uniref:Uncharacterized protein n=1 Tax=Lysobacter korlensis TaxID=553636 RepID=A0ABV6RYN6_9GAMM